MEEIAVAFFVILSKLFLMGLHLICLIAPFIAAIYVGNEISEKSKSNFWAWVGGILVFAFLMAFLSVGFYKFNEMLPHNVRLQETDD